VGAKPERARPSPSGVAPVDGEFDNTVHEAGASTVSAKAAFRSGCSHVQYTRRASATSNCE